MTNNTGKVVSVGKGGSGCAFEFTWNQPALIIPETWSGKASTESLVLTAVEHFTINGAVRVLEWWWDSHEVWKSSTQDGYDNRALRTVFEMRTDES